jgi:surface carbohydrate biosynthesis protein
MNKKIDVLWLVEHIAREMDVACAVKAIAESRYNLNIVVRNVYQHAVENLHSFDPEVVVHPFFYFLKGALATEDYVRVWPSAVHFNLAWEEIHYKAHLKIKAPSDHFTRKKVIHHAWGNFYKRYLMENGVPEENIFVNGHPAYQLYLPPYVNYYRQRAWLAGKYALDPGTRWIFVPENYRWAFIGNKVDLFTKLGGDPQEMLALKKFSLASLEVLLKWCNQLTVDKKVTVVFRPRPSTNSQLISDFVKQTIGRVSPNLHFIKDESVREWILASDVVISSYSTSLLEAAVAGKPSYMVEPIPIPASLYYDWYQHVTHLRTFNEFEAVCLQDRLDGKGALRAWSVDEMLSHGDPILGLAEFMNHLVNDHQRQGSIHRGFPLLNRLFYSVDKKKYFNPATHENDVFTDADVAERVTDWKQVLLEKM